MSKTANFLSNIKSGALQLWSKFGILPSVAAGQAALESAWGLSSLSTKYNNLFGIKGSYQGNSAMMNTWEVYGGQRYDIKAGFRAYPDWATSILDYGVFLTVNQRYKAAIGIKDYKGQITAIHKAGYATDPQYANKVISIIDSYGLAAWDDEVLNKKEAPVTVKPSTSTKTYKVVVTVGGYKTAADAKGKRNKAGTVKAGSYHVFNESQGMINVTSKVGVPGSWINPADNKVSQAPEPEYHVVDSGDIVGRIAIEHKTTIAKIKALNPQIKDIDLIYPGQKIRVK